MLAYHETEVLKTLNEDQLKTYCVAAGCALILYDYSLTLGQEIRLIWTWKSISRSPMALFVLNRCVMISVAVAYILLIPWINCTVTSEQPAVFVAIATNASLAMWALVSALRVYAVTQQRWLLTTVTMLLGLAPVAINTTVQACLYSAASRIMDAQFELLSFSTVAKMGVVARTCNLASDVLVTLVTWYKLHHHKARLPRIQDGLSPAQSLIRDGTLSFIILFLLNATGVVLNRLQIAYSFVYLVDAATTVLISRIMLNLREACFMPDDPTGYELDTETLGAVGETQQSETRSTAVEFPMIASRPESLRTSLSCEPAPSSSARQGNAVHILYMDVATYTLEYGSQGQESDDHQNHGVIATEN